MEDFVIELTKDEDDIKKLVEPILEKEGYELVNLKLALKDYSCVLSLFVDKAQASEKILLKDLRDISLLVSDVLDMNEEEVSSLKKKYELEISSPGVDRPLTKMPHFKNCVGEKIKIRLKRADDEGRRNLLGILKDVHEKAVNIEIEGSSEASEILFSEMAHANKIFIFPQKSEKKKRK